MHCWPSAGPSAQTCSEQPSGGKARLSGLGEETWAVPEKQDGVSHRQLPTGHVGVGHAVLGCPGVAGVSKESDEAVCEHVQLREGVRAGALQPSPLPCPPQSQPALKGL